MKSRHSNGVAARRAYAHAAHAVVMLGLATCQGPSSNPKNAGPPPPSYRVVAGISMGAVGSSILGAGNPTAFDGIGALGGPVDAALLLRMLDRFSLGGFCPRAALEAALKNDPASLNDPVMMNACATYATPLPLERPQNFNHWSYTTNGNFDRDETLSLFGDLTLSFGNFFGANSASDVSPQGVDPAWMLEPPSDVCEHPQVVTGLFNREMNPEGTYPAITFCDGEPEMYRCRNTGTPVDFCSDRSNIRTPLAPEAVLPFAEKFCAESGGVQKVDHKTDPLFMLNHAGAFDACRAARSPARVALAFDLNRNGRRDYGEPVVNNGQERYRDVGVDGCTDAYEDGEGGCLTAANVTASDPNLDNFDPSSRPQGTENNFLFDVGEPFDDDGLDGVPATHDFGEGNGAFDMAPGRRRLLERAARPRVAAFDAATLRRLSFYFDGGRRDVFNLGLQADWLFGTVKSRKPNATRFYDFDEVPGLKNPRTGAFDPWLGRWDDVPSDLMLLYGKVDPTDEDRVAGEGDHVGTKAQAGNRLFTALNWAAARWPALPKPRATVAAAGASPPQRIEWFFSEALGALREYGIALPPGYDAPENSQVRYPTVYLLHGYGQEPSTLMAVSFLTDAFALDAAARFRPMILVFPSGRCCFRNATSGAVDCREAGDDGQPFSPASGWRRQCLKGNFFVDAAPLSGSPGAAYGASFFELVRHVDSTYRTLSTTP